MKMPIASAAIASGSTGYIYDAASEHAFNFSAPILGTYIVSLKNAAYRFGGMAMAILAFVVAYPCGSTQVIRGRECGQC